MRALEAGQFQLRQLDAAALLRLFFRQRRLRLLAERQVAFPERLRVIAFVQNDATREVLQVAEVTVPPGGGKDKK